MRIDIFCKNMELGDSLRAFVKEKIGSLDKFLQSAGEVSTRVEIGRPSLHHKMGPVFYAEVDMKIGGTLLRATAEHYDLRSAITKVKDELKTQITKFKDKRSQ